VQKLQQLNNDLVHLRGDTQNARKEPKLEEMTKRIRAALAPFQRKYLKSIGEPVSPCKDKGIWQEEKPGYLPGCPVAGCSSFHDLNEAKVACEAMQDCGGVTRDGSTFQLRAGNVVRGGGNQDTEEVSYAYRDSCKQRANHIDVWNAFRKTVEECLDDKELNLDTVYKTREDASIYLSISTYRDVTCPSTLKNAYLRAKNPEKLFVGIVQQNCNVQNCMTGTGWGDTRRWVKQDGPDPDCLEEFCLEHPTICKNQIRILRLGEREAYGPFFGRYLNSKLYRGENYYLQIDAHTEFRQDWDYWLQDQMKRTPSYPYSIISNYPPSGDPTSTRLWPAPTDYPTRNEPSALCGCTFEGAGDKHHTVRLSQTSRSFARNVNTSVPHHSAFVAAGFFIAHGSIVENVPFDPFMPYLFMGEEIALSIRFWTSGYDIYGPAIDVLRHEYVRKDAPKFWESITMVFDSGIHNDLTDLIIPRVQNLVGWKDTPSYTDSVYVRADEYGLGKVRTGGQYVRTMNIQLKSRKQQAPDWCTRGLDMPKTTSKRAMLTPQ